MVNDGYWIGDVHVVRMTPEGFAEPDMPISLVRTLQRHEATRVIVDVAQIDLLHSRDVKTLEDISALCRLSGIRMVAACVDAYHAAILVNFLETFEFECWSSIDRAVHALQH
ncbi:MAG: hypothetical protein MI724_09295 [Spirochaetales bacterium]|nr:hypothetical protein [Spirochaetales bacterium]